MQIFIYIYIYIHRMFTVTDMYVYIERDVIQEM